MKVKNKFIILLIIALLLTACSERQANKIQSVDQEQVEDLSPSPGGKVTIQLRNVETLNPLLTQNKGYYQLSKLMYDQLFVVQDNGKIVPSIAEHYELNDSGHTLSVTIRDNIFWEDGRKLTAKDVADTFNALKHLPEDSPYYQMLKYSVTMAQDFNIENFARALVFDERNVDFQFDKPYGNILEMLTFPIYPSHLMTTDQMVSSDNFILGGSGPFLLEEFEENKKIVLVKNPNYHQNVPYIERVEAKIIGTNEKAKQAYEAGQIDIISMDDYTWDKYRANKEMKIETIQTNDMEVLAFNMENPIFQGKIGKEIRRAIFRGINRDCIIDSLYLSQATPASFFLNPEISSGLLLKDEIYYDLDTSVEILRKAGLKDNNNDGWLELPNGEAIELTITTNTEDYLKKTEADLIVEDLKALGIRAKIFDLNTLQEGETLDAKVKSGNFQIAIFGISFGPVPDLAAVLHPNSITNLNISRYNDTKTNEMLEQLSLTWSSEERSRLINNINTRFLEECPYVPLFFKQNVLVRDAKIKQDLHPTIFNMYGGLRDIQVPKDN